MPRVDLAPFSKGLVTDAIGVDGALLEATDVVFDRAGELRKRGGKTAINSAILGTPATSVYGAEYAPGVGFLASVNNGSYRVLSDSEAGGFTSLTSLDARQDGSGGTPAGHSFTWYDFYQHGNEIIGHAQFGPCIKWYGNEQSRYSTGTVDFTSGSTTVTGNGTTWTSSHEGMYLWTNHATLGERAFRVVDVVSNTSLVVDVAPDATAATQSYALNPLGFVAAPDGIFTTGAGSAVNYAYSLASASHQARMFVGSPIDNESVILRWSATTSESSAKFLGCDYWHASGYANVAIGGSIRSLQSYNGELLILQTNALHVLRGVVATDGTDLGATIDLVARGPGVTSMAGATASRHGVVYANDGGVFLWSGGTRVTELSEPIRSLWRSETITAPRVSYSSIRDRVVVTIGTSGKSYVYDMGRRMWTVHTHEAVSVGNVVSCVVSDVEKEVAIHANYVLNWLDDYETTSKNDGDSTAYPRMKITTHPIPLGGKGAIQQGRVDNVYVNGYVTDAASDNPVLTTKLLYGRKGTSTGAETATTLTASVPEGTVDKTHRVPAEGGSSQYSAVRVQLVQSAAASDARVYGIGVDVEPSRVIG